MKSESEDFHWTTKLQNGGCCACRNKKITLSVWWWSLALLLMIEHVSRGRNSSKKPNLIRRFWQTEAGTVHYLACGACSIEWTWLWYWRPSPPGSGPGWPNPPPHLDSGLLCVEKPASVKSLFSISSSAAQRGGSHSYNNSLFLVPRYRFHFGVCQKMWAVSNLDINHSFLCLVLHELVGDPLYGLSVATETQERKHRLCEPHPLTLINLI